MWKPTYYYSKLQVHSITYIQQQPKICSNTVDTADISVMLRDKVTFLIYIYSLMLFYNLLSVLVYLFSQINYINAILYLYSAYNQTVRAARHFRHFSSQPSPAAFLPSCHRQTTPASPPFSSQPATQLSKS